MTKTRKEWKKTVCITIEPKQQRDLQRLSKYTNLNVSEVIRKLLPSEEDIDAFITYQNYVDSLNKEKHPEKILDKIKDTRRLFMEIAMSGHILAPIGLQVAAVSHFDKTGKEISKLFKKFIKALQSIGDCRFESVKFELPSDSKKYLYYVVTSSDESKAKVKKLISKYIDLGDKAEVNESIKKNVRTQGRKPKRKTRK